MAQTKTKTKNRSQQRSRSHQRSNGVADTVDKVKGPALAGGAALAGLVGGVALGRRRGGSKTAAGLLEATKNAGRFSENLGALAGEMRKTRETIDGGTAAKHRSPIEVVLHALTARR